MDTRPSAFASAAAILTALFIFMPSPSAAARQHDFPSESRMHSVAVGLAPLFVENVGQLDPKVRFYARMAGGTIFLTDEGVVFDVVRNYSGASDSNSAGTRKGRNDLVKLERLAFNLKVCNTRSDATIEGLKQHPTVFHHLEKGLKLRDIAAYHAVAYRGIYDRVDLVLAFSGPNLEIDFIVYPGGRPEHILLAYEGIESLETDAEGRLRIRTGFGDLWESRPRLYQQLERETEVAGSFAIRHPKGAQPLGARFYGFEVAAYDPAAALVIDPVLDFATFLGGSMWEDAWDVTVDAVGNIYVAGCTNSGDFPTESPIQGAFAGSTDIFVAKFSPDGELVFATYLGDTGNDTALAIAVDDAADIYIAGYSDSAGTQIPGVYQPANAGLVDGFVARLKSSGDNVISGTYLGGSGNDRVIGLALDKTGNIYLTGWTQSSDFPTQDPLQSANGGGYDVFVSKLDPNFVNLLYSTYLGGSADDYGNGIAVDAGGNVYVSGDTASADFPTHNPYQASSAGEIDAFLAKLMPSGDSLAYATYLGGSKSEIGLGVAVDSAGSAHVTGYTLSNDFPTHQAYQSVFLGGLSDSFVTKFTPSGGALNYSTFLGGTWDELDGDIALDRFGYAYVCGRTASPDFPTLSPYQAALAGADDAFVAKLTPSGSELAYASYFGGANSDGAYAIAVDNAGIVYVAGQTGSTDFPTENAAQEELGGSFDAFVFKYQGETGDAVVYVNKDDDTCGGNSPCRTGIDEALAIVARGGMIKAVQGIYPESLLVEQALSLEGGADASFAFHPGLTAASQLTIATGGTLIPSGLVLSAPGGH